MTGTDGESVAVRVAGSALTLTARRFLFTALSAAVTAVVARLLGVGEFGQLSSALAAYWLAAAASDFGFSLALGRELAARPEEQGRLLRAGVRLQVAVSVLPTLAMLGLAVASGPTSTRGLVLLVLAPSVACSGLGAARQAFLVHYRARRLAFLDLTTNVAQLGVTVAVAAAGGGALGVGAVFAAGAIVNGVVVARDGYALVDAGRPTRADLRSLLGKALPLGVVSFAASVYFTIDLVLLGWLVDEDQLGVYAAACKVLSLLVSAPGILAAAALPGLAVAARHTAELRRLTVRVWHWLAVAGLPLCVGTAVFAAPLVHVAFGPGYEHAVPLVRILAAAGVIAMLNNVLGSVLVARSAVRPMLVQNGAAIVFNVGGNLALVPRYGVTAAAWLTVATEALVCCGSLFILRASVDLPGLARIAIRPGLAVAALAATGLALRAEAGLAVAAAAVVFVLAVVALRAWPEELQALRLRNRAL